MISGVLKTSPLVYQDESGQWWYRLKGGTRKRCYAVECHTCGAEFVARPGGSRTPRHCSKSCVARCTRTGACKQAAPPPRTAGGIVNGVVVASAAMFQDDAGQWFVPTPKGWKLRCTPARCHNCEVWFVPFPNGKHTKTHCTQQCYGECRSKGNHESSSRIRRGQESHLWKGGRIRRKGYVLVYAPDHHSIAGRKTTRRYVFEHRIVMEQVLGRPMKETETVHHLNGITDDNRPENLELWAYQPAGQRVGEGKHCDSCTCGS